MKCYYKIYSGDKTGEQWALANIAGKKPELQLRNKWCQMYDFQGLKPKIAKYSKQKVRHLFNLFMKKK